MTEKQLRAPEQERGLEGGRWGWRCLNIQMHSFQGGPDLEVTRSGPGAWGGVKVGWPIHLIGPGFSDFTTESPVSRGPSVLGHLGRLVSLCLVSKIRRSLRSRSVGRGGLQKLQYWSLLWACVIFCHSLKCDPVACFLISKRRFLETWIRRITTMLKMANTSKSGSTKVWLPQHFPVCKLSALYSEP